MPTKTKVKARPKAKPQPTTPPGAESMLSRDDVATLLRISTRKLTGMRSSGDYPPPDFLIGSRPLWKTSTHNTWVNSRSEPGQGRAR
jgi:hypothetical protein